MDQHLPGTPKAGRPPVENAAFGSRARYDGLITGNLARFVPHVD